LVQLAGNEARIVRMGVDQMWPTADFQSEKTSSTLVGSAIDFKAFSSTGLFYFHSAEPLSFPHRPRFVPQTAYATFFSTHFRRFRAAAIRCASVRFI
jgi:hypothetical protein